MLQILVNFWHLCRVIGKRCISDRLTSAVATLTFTTLLALVPLATICIAIFSAFPVSHTIGNTVSQFIYQNFLPSFGKVVQHYLHDFVKQANRLSLVGIIALVITVVLMMLTVEQTFNRIWKVRHRKLGIKSVLTYGAVLSLAPIFIGLSIATTSYVVSLPLVVGTAAKLGMAALLLHSTPWIFTMLVLWLLYVAIPNCKVPLRYGFIGAIIATVLFELVRTGFVFYINRFATYSFIYGALAIIPIFLLWIYLLWSVVLFGALIANVLTVYYYTGKVGELDGFTHAFLWLGYLWRAQQQGKSLSLKQLSDALRGRYVIDIQVQLQKLLDANFISVINNNRYILACDFSKTTLADLYRVLPWKLPPVNSYSLLSDKMQQVLQDADNSLGEKLDVPLSELY
jgi:membrane protein